MIRISVAVRLKADAETLAIAGGITFQDYVAMEPEWLTSVVREVPLSSSLELHVHRELNAAYGAGIDTALRRATEALR